MRKRAMSEIGFAFTLVGVFLACIAIVLNTINIFNLVRRCDDLEDEVSGLKDDIDVIKYEKAYEEEWSDD
jgi:hypothetical protein